MLFSSIALVSVDLTLGTMAGSDLQKNWRGRVLSLQQHENIRLKQLFHTVLIILCRFVSDNDQASQPYSRVGKQYVLTKCNAEISFNCLPITDIMLLN